MHSCFMFRLWYYVPDPIKNIFTLVLHHAPRFHKTFVSSIIVHLCIIIIVVIIVIVIVIIIDIGIVSVIVLL